MSVRTRILPLVALIVLASAPAQALLKGDLNGDNISDPTDVALLVMALDGHLVLTPAQEDAADVNVIDYGTGVPTGDGVVDRRDLAVLSAAVIGGDPDQDGLSTSFENNLLYSLAWNRYTFDPGQTLDDGAHDADGDGLSNVEEAVAGTNPWLADSDFDGMIDTWELEWGLDPNDPADAALDLDTDGLSNLLEFANGTDPTLADTDGDGLADGEEALSPPYTNPLLWDTDGDLLNDGFEVAHGFNPLADFFQTYADSDGDGLSNLEEQAAGTDPHATDTDLDGYGDGDELSLGSDPVDPLDPPTALDYDLDGVTDLMDNCMRTPNAGQADADGDGFGDACDVCAGDDNLEDPDHDGLCGGADNCPNWASSDTTDSDGNLVGDDCECGDVSDDGYVDSGDVTDLYNALLADDITSLAAHKCDFDGDGLCSYDDYLLLAGYVGGAPTTPVCADQTKLVQHVLGRVSYGGSDYDRRVIAEVGIDGYIQEQLDPPVPGIEDVLERKLDAYRFGTYPVLDQHWSQLNTNYNIFLAGEQLDLYARISWDHAEMKLLRSIYSRRGLEAVLRDLFFNHFNADANQLFPAFTVGLMDEYSIAPRVFGPFEELVHAVAQSDAMLWYLNQNQSKFGDVNENFGRELLELHTLGQGPDDARHYSETDVQEATRILTGYGLGSDLGAYGQFQGYRSHSIFGVRLHDNGAKEIDLNGLLGDGPGQDPAWVFPAGVDGTQADNEGITLINLLSRHPYTAERVSTKLVRRFVSENPPDSVLTAAIGEWTQPATPGTPQGDLRSVLRVIFDQPEFLHGAYVRDKTKRPLQYAASVVRALGEGVEGTSSHHHQGVSFPTFLQSYNGIIGDLWLMGETLYRVGPPTGLPEDSASWTGAGSLLARFNLAHRLASQVDAPESRWGVSHTDSDADLVEGLALALAPAGIRTAEKEAIVDKLEADRQAGLTAGTWNEDDEYERIREAAALVIATPSFLLH